MAIGRATHQRIARARRHRHRLHISFAGGGMGVRRNVLPRPVTPGHGRRCRPETALPAPLMVSFAEAVMGGL